MQQQLRAELGDLKRLIYGSRSERRRYWDVPNQSLLPLEGLDSQLPFESVPATEQIQYSCRKPKKGRGRMVHPGRHPLSFHLPVEEQRLEPAEDVGGWRVLGRR